MRKKRLKLSEGWDAANDRLSQYLAMAQRKAITTYDEERVYYVRLRRVSEAYHRVSQGMYERSELLAPLFVSRSHAAFMSAVQLALSGALPETYMVLRGVLEPALYAYLCSADSSVEEAWTRRNESDTFLKACRRAFRPHDILSRLLAANPQVGQEAGDLYELTINHGGHPNALAVVPHLGHVQDEDGSGAFTLEFLTASRRKRRPCYIHCTRVGLCCLAIFQEVFPDVYAADGGALTAQMDTLRSEMDQIEADLSKRNFFLEDVYLEGQRAAAVRQRLRTADPRS